MYLERFFWSYIILQFVFSFIFIIVNFIVKKRYLYFASAGLGLRAIGASTLFLLLFQARTAFWDLTQYALLSGLFVFILAVKKFFIGRYFYKTEVFLLSIFLISNFIFNFPYHIELQLLLIGSALSIAIAAIQLNKTDIKDKYTAAKYLGVSMWLLTIFIVLLALKSNDIISVDLNTLFSETHLLLTIVTSSYFIIYLSFIALSLVLMIRFSIEEIEQERNLAHQYTKSFKKSSEIAAIGFFNIDFTKERRQVWATDLLLDYLGLENNAFKSYDLEDIKNSFERLTSEDDYKRLTLQIKSGEVSEFKFTIDHIDNKKQHFSLSINETILNSKGEVGKVYGLVTDTTRKVEEMQLKIDLDLKLTSVMKSGDLGLWSVDLKDNNKLWMSDNAQRLCSNYLQDNQGSFYDLVKYIKTLVPAQRIDLHINKLFKEHVADDLLVKIKDGDKERWISIRGQTFEFDENNNLISVRGVIINIDDQVRGKEELEKMSHLFDETSKSGNVGAWMLDRIDDVFVLWGNNILYELLGFDSIDSNYIDFEKLVEHITNNNDSDELILKLRKRLTDYIKGQSNSFEIKYQISNKNIKSKWIHTKSSNIEVDEDGNFSRMYGVCLDIDDQVKYEDEIESHSRVEQISRDIATNLIDIDLMNSVEKIYSTLNIIAKEVDPSRINIYRYDFENNQVIHYYKWNENGNDNFIGKNVRNNLDDFGIPMVNAHSINQAYALNDYMNEDYKYDVKHLEEKKCKSYYSFPILCREKLYGFVDFEYLDNTNFLDEFEMKLLRLFSIVLTNATNKLYIETGLKEREKSFRVLFENLSNGIVVVDKETSNILDANPSFVDMAEIDSKSYIIGKNMYEVYAIFTKTDTSNLQDRLQNFIASAEENGKSKITISGILPNGINKNFSIELTFINYKGTEAFLLSFSDVTQEITLQNVIKESAERYRIAAESTKMMTWVWDLENDVAKCENDVINLFNGVVELDNPIKVIQEIIHSNDYSDLYEDVQTHYRGETEKVARTIKIFKTDINAYIWMFLTAKVIRRAADGTPLIMTGIMMDVNKAKEREIALRNESIKDDLTGLFNANYLNECIERYRKDGSKFVIAHMNISGLRNINELHGYRMGDNVIKYVSSYLKKKITIDGALFRIVGDEFFFLSNDEDFYNTVIDRSVIDYFNDVGNFELDYANLKISVKIYTGILAYPLHTEYIDDAITLVESAMLEAKRIRNEAIIFNQSNYDKISYERGVVEDLERPNILDQFEMYYQPIVNTDETDEVYVEALIRWNHPTRGFLTPWHFIEILENSGYIHEIHIGMYHQVLTKMLEWHQQTGKWVSVSYNIAASILTTERSCKVLGEMAKMIGVSTSHLTLELVEGLFDTNDPIVLENIKDIKEAGFKISIDDFGTSYSSLSRIAELDFDIIKIDKKFIDQIDVKTIQIIVDMVKNLADEKGAKCIVEGVETEDQLTELRNLGLTRIQGYYFYRPMKADKILDVLLNK